MRTYPTLLLLSLLSLSSTLALATSNPSLNHARAVQHQRIGQDLAARQASASAKVSTTDDDTPLPTSRVSSAASVPVTTPPVTTAPASSTTAVSATSRTASATSSGGLLGGVISGVGSILGDTTTTGVNASITAAARPSNATSASVHTTAITDAAGAVILVTETETLSLPTSSSDARTTSTVFATPSSTASKGAANGGVEDAQGGLGTGAIVGIAVGGGVVLLAAVLFLIWRVRKGGRRGWDDDDVDAIKWPELNDKNGETTHGPLPAKPTGGHGFETSALDRSSMDLDPTPTHPSSTSDHDADYSYPIRSPDDGPTYYATTDEGDSDSVGGVSRQRSLGGTRAFEVQPEEGAGEMREVQQQGVTRAKSGRMIL